MVKKIGTNGLCAGRSFLLPLMWCVALLLVSGLGGNGDASAQGVDSYTKLMLHADGSDQGTSFTDSSSGAKTVTNNESYDSYTKLMLHMENNVTDSAAGKTVTNNNATLGGFRSAT